MFFNKERTPVVQDLILATNDYFAKDERIREEAKARIKKDLELLGEMQKEDFYGILKAMKGLPVTIRLLDPPLHEFLPSKDGLMDEINSLPVTEENLTVIKNKIELVDIVKDLHEVNPMLGHRGCRLGLTYEEIYEMQVEAIFKAACQLKKEKVDARPEIMIPLVSMESELKLLRAMVERVADRVQEEYGVSVDYSVGTMIELPRACAAADKIAQHANFFSFGTNDLTQTTFGFSRDDAERKFFGTYIDKKIMNVSPFEMLDQEGVGTLMKLAIEKARSVKPDIKLGICGEHGGEPSSVEFCYTLGLSYVSCSPKRIPVARHASAIATLKHGAREDAKKKARKTTTKKKSGTNAKKN